MLKYIRFKTKQRLSKLFVKILLVVICLFTNASSFAKNRDSKSKLIDYYTSMADFQKPKADKKYYLNIESISYRGNSKPVTIKTIATVTQDVVEYRSSYVTFLLDTTNLFMIDHKYRRISWLDAKDNFTRNELLGKMSLASSIEKLGSSIVSESDSVLNKQKYTVFHVQNDSISEQIFQMHLFYNQSEKIIDRIESEVNQQKQSFKQCVLIHNQEAVKLKREDLLTAKQRVFNSKGELQNQYKGFKILDNRNK